MYSYLSIYCMFAWLYSQQQQQNCTNFSNNSLNTHHPGIKSVTNFYHPCTKIHLEIICYRIGISFPIPEIPSIIYSTVTRDDFKLLNLTHTHPFSCTHPYNSATHLFLFYLSLEPLHATSLNQYNSTIVYLFCCSIHSSLFYLYILVYVEYHLISLIES